MHESIWTRSVDAAERPTFPRLEDALRTDVLIIGAGAAGLLCAHALKRRGVECVVVEAGRVCSGITANTTAKITAQHGLIYSDIMRQSGQERAKAWLDANLAALDTFKALSAFIPCDLEVKDSYVYSDDRVKLEREAEAYRRMGIEANIEENPPIPIKTAGALAMQSQAQFNPVKFLSGLSVELNIFENTFVEAVKGNTAYTRSGAPITAECIIIATHFPFINTRGLYFVKLYQHRSYVIALDEAPNINGMYVDERPEGNSFRNYGDLLLVGGGDHRTGKQGGGWAELRALAGAAYPESAEICSWAAQDCITMDGLPYVGPYSRHTPELYVMTGFNKWGFTASMAGAELIADMLSGKISPISDIVSPQRAPRALPLLSNVFHAAGGLLSFGKRCPHMGCALRWNKAERTWDCPCHGSRFTERGELLDNPATGDKQF